MLPDDGTASLGSDADHHFDEARAFWELIPCAISLWSRERSYCLLNRSAKRLINYSETDFLNRPSLWVDRIHPDDQQNFLKSQERLAKSKSPVQCDYRFFPRNADSPLWIREISTICQGKEKIAWHILSMYTEISDLKATNSETKDNHITNAAKLVGVEEDRASQNPLAVLDNIVQKMRKELNRQRVNLHVVRRGPLPMVQGDDEQLHSAFERVFQFCGAMLKDGGNLEVEAGPKELGGQVYAEVKLTTRSVAFIEPDKQDVFQSDVGIEGGRNEFGIDLAREILSRYRGQISFQRKGRNRSQVTILIRASSK